MSRVSLKLFLLESTIRVVFPLLGVVLLVSGLFGVISFGALPLVDAMRSRQWTPVPATLESARIAPAQILRNRPLPALEVRFHYQFGGMDLVGNRYDLHYGFDHRGALEASMARLPAGTELVAWVNPHSPDQVMLQRSLNWPLLALVIPFGAIGLTGGLLLLGGMVGWNEARPLQRGEASARVRD
ncbi:MAG: DUF3592 domain-containing protein [Azoarcus sp.]|nr:DUF3592 domain-containing protein [Azoarcus sp.]